MSGGAENTDPITALNSSIHLNEEDWLQFLQKLTPTSIENLQQTLKRLQQPEPLISPTDKLSFLATASQLCGSPLLASSATESNVLNNQNASVIVSLGASKSPAPSVVSAPPVLNAAKSVSTAMSNTIVLPSALLITPSGHGQTFSLDSRLSTTGINRLVVTSGDLLNVASGSGGSSVPSSLSSALGSSSSMNEAYSSLNTLATAAVAVAASSTKQWASGSGCSSKETTSMDVVNNFPQVFDTPSSIPCTTSTCIPVSTTAVNSQKSTTENLFSSLYSNQSDLSNQLLPSLSAAGITVYPIQVSANGPTVLMAATPAATTTINTTCLLNRSGIVSIPTVTTPTCCLLTTTNSVNSTPATVSTPQTTNSASRSGTFVSSLLNPTLSTNSNSIPRTKPKFKALWDSNLGTLVESSGGGQLRKADSPNIDSTTDSTNLLMPILTPGRTTSHSNNKRQSPLLIGSKSIGQTPKRLAASAASSAAVGSSSGISTGSTDESKPPNQPDGGSKKLLLVCSQPQQLPSATNRITGYSSTSNVNISTTGTVHTQPEAVVEPTLAKVIATHQLQVGRSRADLDQSELVFLTNPNLSLSSGIGVACGAATERLVASQSEGQSSSVQKSSNLSGGIFVPNRSTKLMLVNHNSTSTVKTSVAGSNSGHTDTAHVLVPMSTVSDSEVSSGPVPGVSNQKTYVDISKRVIVRTDEVDQVGDDEARRRAKRRERNRVAAAKCRQRRQDQILELQHRVGVLNRTGQELRTSIQSLDEERSRLEELIRQHGLAGCSAAEEFLASTSTNDSLMKEEENVAMETGDNDEEMSLGPVATFGSAEDVMTGAAAYSNSGPTTSCSSPTSPASRSAMKPDTESSDVGSRVASRLLRTGSNTSAVAPTNGTTNYIKADQMDVAERSSVDSTSDGSESRQNRTTSQSCHSPPATKTRLVVARPCTLLPPKRTLELSSSNTSSTGGSTGTNSTASIGFSVANTTAITTPGNSTPMDTPIISHIWPSGLHYFSPILTPSAWKVIPKDCGSGDETPGASTPTGKAGSSVSNSSVAAAAAALFLSSPSLTSSLTNACTSTNLLVSTLVNSIQSAAAAAGGTVLTTPSTDMNDMTPATISSNTSGATSLFCLPEVLSSTSTTGSVTSASVTATTINNPTSFNSSSSVSGRDRNERHTREEINATVTQ